MSTANEHYQEAEDLLRRATIDRDQLYAESNLEPSEAIAAAQVHATLALAAISGASRTADEQAWRGVVEATRRASGWSS